MGATTDSTTEPTLSRAPLVTSATKMLATLTFALPQTHATAMLPAPITLMAPRAVLATTVSTVTDTSASSTPALFPHARPTPPVPTREMLTPVLAMTASTSVTTPSKAPPVTSVTKLPVTLMSAIPIPTHATLTLPAPTTLTVPSLALATLTSRETATPVLTLVSSTRPRLTINTPVSPLRPSISPTRRSPRSSTRL